MSPELEISQEHLFSLQEAPLWVQVIHPVSVLIGVSEKEVHSHIFMFFFFFFVDAPAHNLGTPNTF